MATTEETEIDETAEKAKEIGKELGVAEDAEPDFEIEEEPDQEDDRVAKSREPAEKKEKPQLTNREKRLLRKKKINDKFGEKDRLIEEQAARLAAAEARLAEMDNRFTGINKAEVEKALNDTRAIFQKAEADSLTAFNEGDGVKHLKALQAMSAANDRLNQLNGVKQQLERSPAQTVQTREAPRQDPAVSTKYQEWASRNEWFSQTSGDVDSEVAKGISSALIKAGFDPKSDDFWDELDDRLEGKITAKDEEVDEPAVPQQKRRATPPVTGAGSRTDIAPGKKKITLPTSYIRMLKENGIWDDIPRRNKVIADRERILRESQQ